MHIFATNGDYCLFRRFRANNSCEIARNIDRLILKRKPQAESAKIRAIFRNVEQDNCFIQQIDNKSLI